MKLLSILMFVLFGTTAIGQSCHIRGQVGTDWTKRSHKPYYAERILQISLNRFGPLQTLVDGSLGPSTAKAIHAFQKIEGLRQSGRPDPDTLLRLAEAWSEVTPIPPIAAAINQTVTSDIVAETKIDNGDCQVTITGLQTEVTTFTLNFKSDLTDCRLTRFYNETKSRAVYVRNLATVGVMIDVKSPSFGTPKGGFQSPVIAIWPDGSGQIAGIQEYEAAAKRSENRLGLYPNWQGPFDNKGFAFHSMRHPDYIGLGHNQWSWCPWFETESAN